MPGQLQGVERGCLWVSKIIVLSPRESFVEARPFVEKLITKSKKNDLSAAKYLAKYLPEKARKKIVAEIGSRYQSRAGGYTRIIKLGPRKTDGAKMAVIELVE